MTPTNELSTSHGGFSVDVRNGSGVDSDPDSISEHEVESDIQGSSNGSLLLVARMDAVRVLALALNVAIEDTGARRGETSRKRNGTTGAAVSFRNEVQRFEATLIRSALTYTGGRQRRAARLLGINVSTMNSKIKRYKITPDELSI